MVASAFLLLPAGLAQRPGGGAQPPGGGATPGGNPGGTRGNGQGGVPQGTVGTPNNTNNGNPSTPLNRTIFISGQVIMDDGSALPQNVAIQRVCNGMARIESYANSSGYFGFNLGARTADALQDASTSGFDDFNGLHGPDNPNSNSTLPLQLAGCELRASLAGYQSQSVDLSLRQPMDNPDVGTILLHRLGGTQGTTISATTLNAPKSARKAFRKAMELEKKKKLPGAVASLQQAVAEHPRYAEAWYELGRAQADQGEFDSARQSFEAALRSDENFVPPYVQISFLDLREQRWQALADVSGKAVQLDPFTYPQAFFLNAVANYNLQHVDLAEQSARRAEKLDTRHQMPQVSRLLGTILIMRRDFAGAAAEFRNYLKFDPQSKDAAAVRSQIETLEKQSGPQTAAKP